MQTCSSRDVGSNPALASPALCPSLGLETLHLPRRRAEGCQLCAGLRWAPISGEQVMWAWRPWAPGVVAGLGLGDGTSSSVSSPSCASPLKTAPWAPSALHPKASWSRGPDPIAAATSQAPRPRGGSGPTQLRAGSPFPAWSLRHKEPMPFGVCWVCPTGATCPSRSLRVLTQHPDSDPRIGERVQISCTCFPSLELEQQLAFHISQRCFGFQKNPGSLRPCCPFPATSLVLETKVSKIFLCSFFLSFS